MDLFHKLNNNIDFLQHFCEILESLISEKKLYPVIIDYKKNQDSIFFFIDGSSILQILPDKDLQYTYANVPSYQDEIKTAIKLVDTQYIREKKINDIIKKES